MISYRHLQIENVFLYSLGFLLFWEWLRPLEEVTDTANSIYFVVFVGVCFFVYLFKIPFILSFPIRILILFNILHRLFYEGSFFQKDWIHLFYEDTMVNIQALLSSQWFVISDLFRSFLFLILLWVMSYLIHYWLIQVKNIWGFYIITIIFLCVLDTFTVYDGSGAIVRTVVIGFFMLALLQMARIKEREGLPLHFNWLVIISGIIAVSVFIGMQVPKAGPKWPDPVPFMKSAATGQLMGGGFSKIGYGIDDSRLGGAFINDETTVFTAEVQHPHYWRIESKDYYTGKGWGVSRNIPHSYIDKDNINLRILENVPTEQNMKETVYIENIGGYPHIPYPTDLRALKTNQSIQLLVDSFTGKLYAEKDGMDIQLNSYEILYDYPSFSIEALQLANAGDDSFIRNVYTQLPGELPDRIYALAGEITENLSTRYEKVKAVETFFSEQGYAYETKDVAIPEGNQDYVDQFLFETKKGYCDNFSTSMVILLRTLDIPARWVKGYTQGEYMKSLNTGGRLYEVKNSNAHSWVEVYFPGIGWVPFEPTSGFSNASIFTENTVPVTAPIEEEIDDDLEQTESEIEEDKQVEENDSEENTNISIVNVEVSLKQIFVLTSLLILLIGLLIRFKSKWKPYWILLIYRLRVKNRNIIQAYEVLLKLLEHKGLKIQTGETLREYATRIDEQLGTVEMKQLTEVYEKLLYFNREQKDEDWELNKENWENLVKKIAP